ncbi:unnamed protein product [Cuscuta epithymum]|uniref:Uncharacterized protein n=1 Tax=Cuscuta epithymum TaxID=186058 RepID=A0AAV0FTV9_9ASTE|nr:unnamed protein product [Cuscuta epithymum]CAH9138650.1 unnamed protein product [Cuscuta epithymum]
MEILSPATSPSSYISSSIWLSEESSTWTAAENKAFENALALYDKDTPDRWRKVAAMVPGKTVLDVMRQYKELEDDISSIEAGYMDLIPFPAYDNTSSPTTSSPLTFFEKQCLAAASGKRSMSSRQPEHERKKGIPWTEEEHKLFLLGLKKYGKGDWRNIARNFVITRTPTQVASHAQKYFIRQISGGKDKRRASIHDITMVTLNENPPPATSSADTKNHHGSTYQPIMATQHQNSTLLFHAQNAQGNTFISPTYGIESYGMNRAQRDASTHGSYFGTQVLPFHMPSAAPQYYP